MTDTNGPRGMSAPRDESNLHEILSAICDETATADQIDRLAERLRTDAAARRFYVRYLDMHARLASLPTVATAADAATENDTKSRAGRWWAAAWGGAAAAVAIAAVLLGSRARQVATPEPAAQTQAAVQPQPAGQTKPAVLPYVATIVEASPESLLDGRPVTLGGRLTSGRFHLTHGPCTLRFDGGAQLVFGDEARFEIVSRNAVRIEQAAFTFRGDITCEAISITTPQSTLRDVGTEYTAVVTPGVEDIHVADGMVRRTSSRGDAAPDLLPAKTGRSYVGHEAVGRIIEFDPAPVAGSSERAATPARMPVPPLAWDRFDTGAERIGGAGGGAGWREAWISHDTLPEYAIRRPGLSGPSSGAIAHAGAGSAAAHRYLASPIDLGTDGVWYVRYLVRRPAMRERDRKQNWERDKDPNLAMLVLRTWGLTNEQEIERQSSLQLGVCQAATLAVKFNGQSVRSAVRQAPDETYAFVAKIVAGRTTPDQVFAGVFAADQLGDREPLEWAAVTDCVSATHVFDQVSVEIVSRGEVLLGDIAIGTTWSSISFGEATSP